MDFLKFPDFLSDEKKIFYSFSTLLRQGEFTVFKIFTMFLNKSI